MPRVGLTTCQILPSPHPSIVSMFIEINKNIHLLAPSRTNLTKWLLSSCPTAPYESQGIAKLLGLICGVVLWYYITDAILVSHSAQPTPDRLVTASYSSEDQDYSLCSCRTPRLCSHRDETGGKLRVVTSYQLSLVARVELFPRPSLQNHNWFSRNYSNGTTNIIFSTMNSDLTSVFF